MSDADTRTHIRASATAAPFDSRIASTDNVCVEFLRCSSGAVVEWHVAKPEFGLVCARSAANGMAAPGAAAKNFWFSPEGVDAKGELHADPATDCIGLFVRPSFIPRTIREELPEPIAGLAHGTIGRAFSTLMGEFRNTSAPSPIHIEGLAIGVLANLALGRSATVRRRQATGLAPWQLRRAKETMLADLSDNLPLQTVARACRLSISHFSRAFKASVGIPPHRWLIAVKVESARHLLSGSETPLAEIADMCGFADQSHFSRVFARYHAMSPGTWRREHRI